MDEVEFLQGLLFLFAAGTDDGNIMLLWLTPLDELIRW